MIRLATLDDMDELVRLGRLFHAESPRYRGIEFKEADARLFIRKSFESPTTRRIFVAEHDGVLSGMMGAELQVFAMFNHEVLYSVDFGFYVVPERRGSTIAYRMVQAYEGWARESGIAEENICLALSAGIEFEQVHEFLQRMGYTQMGASYRKAG